MRCGISAAAGLAMVLAGNASASDPQPTGPWQVPVAPVVIDCDLDGDGRLSSFGTLPGRQGVSWSPLVIDGSGQVVAHCRGQVLQTWYHTCLYRLTEEGGLEAIAEESYAMDTPLVMLDDFEVHVARDTSAATFRLRAGERIVVVGSDDRRWCEIEAADGRRGWFTVQGYSRLADGRRAEEVFAGLANAD